jgi:hypothetical protein
MEWPFKRWLLYFQRVFQLSGINNTTKTFSSNHPRNNFFKLEISRFNCICVFERDVCKITIHYSYGKHHIHVSNVYTSQSKRSIPAVTASQTPSLPTSLFGIDKLNFNRNLMVGLLRAGFTICL